MFGNVRGGSGSDPRRTRSPGPAIYGVYTPRHQRAIIRGDHKLIHYPEPDVYRLFNLTDDPHEIRDLVADVEHAETLARLKRQLIELQRSMDDPLMEGR